MRLILKIVSGPEAGRRITLARGYRYQIGSTDWADQCVADPAMAAVHLLVDFTQAEALVENLAGAGLATCNGEPLARQGLLPGDRISAGESTFEIDFEGEGAPQRPAALPDATPPEPEGPRAADFCQHIRLSAPAKALLAGDPSPEAYADMLGGSRQLLVALQFMSHWLPPVQAIAWLAECLPNHKLAPSPDEAKVVELALAWVAEPKEDIARQCEALSESLPDDAPARWLALAVFWNGPSLAPAGNPEVPPAPHLPGVAVATAWLLSFFKLQPEQHQAIFQAGRARGVAVQQAASAAAGS